MEKAAWLIAIFLSLYDCFDIGGDDLVFKVIPNPDCDTLKGCPANETKLIQVVVERRDANSVHFLLSGNGSGTPTSVVMIEGPPKPSKLEVNWTNFLKHNGTDIWNSVKLKDTITSYGFIFYEVRDLIILT